MKIKKIRKTISILLLLTALVVTQIPVSDVIAEAPLSDFSVEDGVLIKYTGTRERVVTIPAGVEAIGEGAFAGHNELVQVIIGDEVTSISNRAFTGCKSLRTVVCGDAVRTIGSGAFSSCPNLVSVTLGDSVAMLGNGVFAGCDNLDTIHLSEENPYLSYRYGVIYDQDETIIYQMLPGYQSRNYVVPPTVTDIRGYAFWGNTYLQTVTLGTGLDEIPAYAFSNCPNLAQVTLPYTVHTIAAKAFEDCINLEEINLPESVSSIHASAFDGCYRVAFDTVAGTYGETFAESREVSPAERAEQTELIPAPAVNPAELPEEEVGQETESGDAGQTETENDMDADLTDDPSEIYSEPLTPENVLGSSSIVSGRAWIFIDNQGITIYNGTADGSQSVAQQTAQSGPNTETAVIREVRLDSENTDGRSEGAGSESGTVSGTASLDPMEGDKDAYEDMNRLMENLLYEEDVKGAGFPKYTVVDGTVIADQAYYQNQTLTVYEMDEAITEIGDFAFSRTPLKEIVIPEGVVRIGYGAFYHCDDLQQVTIPDTVTEIEPAAFDHTPWLLNRKNQVGEDFLVVGDGILLAYFGQGSVVNIPDGVKQIGAGVFQDHMGITAVNLPDSLMVIGEDAFAGCRNLKTVNGGEGVTQILDRAFEGCALNKVYISEQVESIGLRAFDLSDQGTGSVTFGGSTLPRLSAEKSSMRLTNEEYRGLAFDGMEQAFIADASMDLSGTVLDEALLGFRGAVCLPDGTVITEHKTVRQSPDTGVSVRIDSSSLQKDAVAKAELMGGRGSYLLDIRDSEQAAEAIKKAYGTIYGGAEPSGLLAYDISLYEQSGHSRIDRLGRQSMTITLPLPESMGTENLHVVCVDHNGQLEEADYQILSSDEGDLIELTATHFSAYGIYQYSGQTGVAATGSGTGRKDETPDTGDWLHPKWMLAFGLLCTAGALYFYQRRPEKGA